MRNFEEDNLLSGAPEQYRFDCHLESAEEHQVLVRKIFAMCSLKTAALVHPDSTEIGRSRFRH